MFKIKKEKTSPFNHKTDFSKLSDEEIKEFIIKTYPFGCTVDQRTAYRGKGGTVQINSENVRVQRYEDFEQNNLKKKGPRNVSIGGFGVWSDEERRLAKIVKYV